MSAYSRLSAAPLLDDGAEHSDTDSHLNDSDDESDRLDGHHFDARSQLSLVCRAAAAPCQPPPPATHAQQHTCVCDALVWQDSDFQSSIFSDSTDDASAVHEDPVGLIQVLYLVHDTVHNHRTQF